MKKTSLAVLTALGLAAPAAALDCRYTAPHQADLEAGGVTRVEVVARAGSLRIQGRPGSRIHAKGTACASDESILREIKFSATRNGSTVRVVAETPDHWMNNGYGYLHLEIEVPPGVALDVEDGSGELEIRGVGALTLDDGSGEIELADIGGDLSVRDGSGELEVSGVRGNVTIDDGSGAIEVSDVEGGVRVRSDRSGSITVRNVRGDFVVERDGSGGIRHTAVSGQVSIPRGK